MTKLFKKVQDLYKYITPSPRSIICFILYLFGIWYSFSKLSFAATKDVFFFLFFFFFDRLVSDYTDLNLPSSLRINGLH